MNAIIAFAFAAVVALFAPADPSEANASSSDDEELRDDAVVTGAVVGGILGALFGGTAAGIGFYDTLLHVQEQSGCAGTGCEGYGFTIAFLTPVVVFAGAGAGGILGAMFGGYAGGELADADWSQPAPVDLSEGNAP